MLSILLSNLLYIGARAQENQAARATMAIREQVRQRLSGDTIAMSKVDITKEKIYKQQPAHIQAQMRGMWGGTRYGVGIPQEHGYSPGAATFGKTVAIGAKVTVKDSSGKVTKVPSVKEATTPTYYYDPKTETKTYRMDGKEPSPTAIPITKELYESKKPLEIKETKQKEILVGEVKPSGEVEYTARKSLMEGTPKKVTFEVEEPEIEEEPVTKPLTRAELFSEQAKKAFGIKEEGGMLVTQIEGRKRYYEQYTPSGSTLIAAQDIADIPISATYKKGFERQLGAGKMVEQLIQEKKEQVVKEMQLKKPFIEEVEGRKQLRKIELGDIFRAEKKALDFLLKQGDRIIDYKKSLGEVEAKPIIIDIEGRKQLRKLEFPEDILRLKGKYPSVYEDVRKGAIYPLKLAKSIFYDIPSQFLAEPSEKVGKIGVGVTTKLIAKQEWAIETLNKSEYKQLTEPITKSLEFGKEITRVTKGFFREFEEHPKRTYPLIMGAALATELLGGIATSKLATTSLGEKIIPPAIKGITKGLGLAYAGTVGAELAVTPKEERAELLGRRIQPITLLWLGSTVATKLKLKDTAFKSVFEKTKYAGLSESEAKQYWMAEKGKPLITSQKMKYQILGRELAIQEPQFKTPAGEAFIQTGLEAKEFWKLSQESGLSFLKSSVFYKDVVKKTELDFSLVERIKPLGIKAPPIMAGVSATYPKLVTGGSLVPASVFKEEFKIFRITPHDIDQYISGSVKGLVEWEYKALGGKQIPKRLDIDVRPVLDTYKQKALEIIKKRGGRVTGATALQLQVKDFGRIARDIDVEFKKDITGYKLTTTSLEKAPSTILKDLEKEFGKGLFEIEEGRHKKIIWSEDLGLYKKGETFLDIGKWREGYRTRTLKGLKVTHVLDVLEDKKAIAKYLSKKLVDPTKYALKEMEEGKLDIKFVKKIYGEKTEGVLGRYFPLTKRGKKFILGYYDIKGKAPKVIGAEIQILKGLPKKLESKVFTHELFHYKYQIGKPLFKIGGKGSKLEESKIEKAMRKFKGFDIHREKVAKAQRDILATRKGLADLYKFGVLRIDEDKLFTRPLTEIKKWDKFIEAHSLKEMLYPNIMSVSPLYRTPKSYLLKTKTGARVLSPAIQQRRAIVGAFADLRYKDVFKFIPMKLGELGLAKTRAKGSIFEAFKLRDIMKKRDILTELTEGRMFRLASVEAGIEKLSEKQISLLIGGKKKKVSFPKAGELDIFEKTYGKEATEKLFKTKEFKRLGKRDYVEQILREKKPKIKPYPSYKKYFAFPYPLYYDPLYEQYRPPESYKEYEKAYKPKPYKKPYKKQEQYWPYKHPYRQYISHAPYKKPYEPYTPYKPYKPYRPYQPYPLYEPYKGYKPYKPYKPYSPYKPYKAYQPYKPYAPYSPYEAYEVYEPRIPPYIKLLLEGRIRRKKKERTFEDDLAYVVGFTSRQLGLSMDVTKKALKEAVSEKMFTGFEFRKMPVLNFGSKRRKKRKRR